MMRRLMSIETLDDPKILRGMLAEALEQLRLTRETLDARETEVAALTHRLKELLRRFYGPRSEKIAPGQLPLAFADDDLHAELKEKLAPHAGEAPDDEEPPQPKRRKRKPGNGRAPLPPNLPRTTKVHEPAPAELVCGCCGKAKSRIGEEKTEELEYVPASLHVIEHVRPKYACPSCQGGVVIADLPPSPIAKGRPGPGLLAQIVVSKYGDHLPLNRQTEIFGRHGLPIHRSTLCDWIAETAELLGPIVRAMKREILASGYVNTGDTPVRIHLGKDNSGKTKEGRIWIYASPELRQAVYDFTTSREGEGPRRFLLGFAGFLQADAYSGYDRLFADGEVVEVGCMAHCRRKFFDARSTNPEAASLVLAVIRALYHIEEGAKAAGLSPEERRRIRQVEAAPLLSTLREFLERERRPALPKSPWGEAIGYALNQWDALVRYTEDGRLSIDNNPAEQGLRRIAVGRSNWLFAGSPAGGKRAATLYSLIESCRLQGVEPFEYLRDVLSRLHVHPMGRISEITPRGWRLAKEAAAATSPTA